MYVYFKNLENKLGVIQVDTNNHADAILSVKESLVDSGEGYQGPVLAVIVGGK